MAFLVLDKTCPFLHPVESGPEKLVICVDSAMCRSNDVKSRIRTFLDLKSMVNQHEFAVMLMTNSGGVEWVCDFTVNIKTVISSLNDSRSDYSYHKDYDRCPSEFNMSQVFEMLLKQWENVRLEKAAANLRMIMLYSRINCLPVLQSDNALSKLLSNDSVTIDILNVPALPRNVSERPPDMYKAVEAVYRQLYQYVNEHSYIFCVEAKDLSRCTARLLAHPKLRGPQKSSWLVS